MASFNIPNNNNEQKTIEQPSNSTPLGSGYDVNIGGIEPNPNSTTPVNSSPQTGRTVTKEFNVDDIKKANVVETIKVDFLSDASSSPHDFLKEKATDAIHPISGAGQPKDAGSFSSTGGAPNPAYINDTSASGSGSFSAKPMSSRADFRSTVKVIVAGFDILASNGLCLLAGDTSSTMYSASAQQRTLLEDALVELMYEKQTKMPSWVLVVIGVVGAYGFQASQAIQKRRAKNLVKPIRSGTALSNQSSALNQTQPQNQQFSNPNPIKQPAQAPQQSFTPQQPAQKQEMGLAIVDHALNADDKGNVYFPNPEFTFKNPDPELVAKDRNDAQNYISRGMYPKYMENKGNKVRKEIKYNDKGEIKMGGRPPKIGI